MAASTALSFATHVGFHSGILESDSLVLATALIKNNTISPWMVCQWMILDLMLVFLRDNYNKPTWDMARFHFAYL